MIGHRLSRLLLTTALTVVPVFSYAQEINPVAGGDLGIDCDVPRRAPDGRIILDWRGEREALCEADRTTALNHAALLETVRDRVARALHELPPPLLNSFLAHMDAGLPVAEWRPNQADLQFIAELAETYQRGTWFNRAVDTWRNGVLADTGVVPEEWGISVAVCGVRDAFAGGSWQVLTWMDNATLGERWTPEMVQRAVAAWLDDRDGETGAERAPVVTAGTTDAPLLRRTDGHELAPMDCMGNLSGSPWADAIPEPHLTMETRASVRPSRKVRVLACTNLEEVGYTREARHPWRGVFVDTAGNPVPLTHEGVAKNDGWVVIENTCRPPEERDVLEIAECEEPYTMEWTGEQVYGRTHYSFRFREHRAPLTAAPEEQIEVVLLPINGDGTWTLAGQQQTPQPNPPSLFCEPGEAPDGIGGIVTETTFPVDSCMVTHSSKFPEGTRTGHRVRYDFPDHWKISDYTVEWIEDQCYILLPTPHEETRAVRCPAGQNGLIREGRSWTVWHRHYANPVLPTRRDERTVIPTFGFEANLCWVEEPWTETERNSGCRILERDITWGRRNWIDETIADEPKYRRISESAWRVVSDNCRRGGGGDNGGRGGGFGVDTDGDGRADVELNNETRNRGDIVSSDRDLPSRERANRGGRDRSDRGDRGGRGNRGGRGGRGGGGWW
ncbi:MULTISPECIES: hypothetical protein [unclassified Roseobacter]|uniref:hypothetical protein n=1 Tax=unclassified Roseobacter TaxID=196798 RepID=UPI001C0F2561|nr:MULTISPECIES: hypothetical protein [unclassified Roseobacter]